MNIGFIRINGTICQIFLSKKDEYIQDIAQKLKKQLIIDQGLDVSIEWNNNYSEKSAEELIQFAFSI